MTDAELQTLVDEWNDIKEQEDQAIRMFESLQTLKEGDEQYDAILNDFRHLNNPTARTKEAISKLVRSPSFSSAIELHLHA
jgi:CHASE3 domain sensor protein